MMSEFVVVETAPDVETYQRFRESAGWDRAPEARCDGALRNSAWAAVAYRNDDAVGMARVIGDGVYWYVQDVIVVPEARGHGLGQRLMAGVERFLAENSSPGTFIGLMAANGVENFYTRWGYRRRDDGAPGMFKTVTREPRG
ncbi:MAG: GNAT family N-acetyltransferase [Planctomycetota bacterium]